MLKAVVDTHAIIWFIESDPCLSNNAQNFLTQILTNGDQLGISSITLVETVYLIEKSRVAATILSALEIMADDPNSGLIEIPYNRQMLNAFRSVKRSDVPDMPDRIIAATAAHLNLPLVSRDAKIQASGITTIW